MFGIGLPELVVIIGLALVVFGPEKLPEVMRQAARYYRDLQRLSTEVTGEFQRALELDAEPKRTVPTTPPMAQPTTSVAPQAAPPRLGSRLAADDYETLKPPY